MAPLVMKFILIVYFFVLMGYDNWNRVVEHEHLEPLEEGVDFDNELGKEKKPRKTVIMFETPI
jgi:hypothetical protein